MLQLRKADSVTLALNPPRCPRSSPGLRPCCEDILCSKEHSFTHLMVPCSYRDESQVLGIIQTMSFVLAAQARLHVLPATGVRHLQSNVLGIRPLLALVLQLHKTRNQREISCAGSGSIFPPSSLPARPLLCPAAGTCPCITTW